MDIFFACTILINTVSCFIALICAASVIQGTASRQTKLMNADVRRSLALSRATVYLIARGCVHLRYIGAEIAVNSAAVLLRVLVSGSNEPITGRAGSMERDYGARYGRQTNREYSARDAFVDNSADCAPQFPSLCSGGNSSSSSSSCLDEAATFRCGHFCCPVKNQSILAIDKYRALLLDSMCAVPFA